MPRAATILRVRNDLRLTDNPALVAAAERGNPIVPLFIWSPEEDGTWPPGAASRWWLDQSLRAFDETLRARGSRLVVRRGPTLDVVQQVVRETGADAVVWNRRYEPAAMARDSSIKGALREQGILAKSFNSALLFEPWENTKGDGSPYRVFTPFWKALLRRAPVPEPSGDVKSLAAPPRWPDSLTIADLTLLPEPDWAGGLRQAWTPGEVGATAQLERLLAEVLDDYATSRDYPGREGTARLSPHLHFGEIGPRTLWKAVRDLVSARDDADAAAESWLRQLAWRDFAHHLLFHFPHTTDAPLQEQFARFDWSEDSEALEDWQRGRTGYPIVDAGMRELWTTGWMHNRVRMIVASFLVKDLRLAWQEGARWFWDTLVDADLASNTMGWQWTAGCGADAAPYFRVFNPLLQSRRFDRDGEYLRRWLPELARLDGKWIHQPYNAPASVLESAGVRLGQTYPLPIIAHDQGRRLALEAYEAMRRGSGG